jgi:glycosyltransferase 2 family protein
VRARIPLVVATVLTAALVILAVRTLDADAVWDALREADLRWLVPAVLALVVAFVLRALRWWLIFQPERRPPLDEVTGSLAIGLFFNAVLPFRAGELARLVVLHRRTQVPRLEILGTIAAERIYDVLALLLLLAASVPWLPDVSWLRAVAVAGGVLALAAAALSVTLLVWGERAVAVVLWPLRFLRSFPEERRAAAAENLLLGVAALHRPRAAAVAAVMTVVSFLAFWVSSWLLLQGFDLGVGGAAAMLVLVATGFSLAVPSGPSAVGVWEAAVIVALLPFDVTAEAALSYGLVLHALNIVPYLVGGLVALALMRGSIVARDGGP